MGHQPLYLNHPRSLTTLYSDLDQQAALETRVHIGTTGSLLERTNSGEFKFYSHQFYDVFGKKRERYVSGPVGDAEADKTADTLKLKLEEHREIGSEIRLLGREGYQITDKKTYATIATLHNHDFFRAGGLLIGSHAFSALINYLGVRAAAYATEDINVARAEPLVFDTPPTLSFLEMLRESGVPFVEIPPLNRKMPSAQWKERGRARFHVDLLVPSRDDEFRITPVPELSVHAQSIPYLRYLLSESHFATILSRHGGCQVRVPLAERFAVHKLLVSQLRVGRGAKVDKDLSQASVLIAALGELHSGAIADALLALPLSARSAVRRSVMNLRSRLESTHPQAWEELSSVSEEWS